MAELDQSLLLIVDISSQCGVSGQWDWTGTGSLWGPVKWEEKLLQAANVAAGVVS